MFQHKEFGRILRKGYTVEPCFALEVRRNSGAFGAGQLKVEGVLEESISSNPLLLMNGGQLKRRKVS